MSEDYYKILEVTKDASQDDIQKAYRKLARKHHPDLNQDDPKGATLKFQKVQEAYDVLGTPEKRSIYDRFGVSPNQMGSGGGQGPHQWSFGAGGPGGNSFRGGGGTFTMDDILKMFGAGQGAGQRGAPTGDANEYFGMGGGPSRRPVAGADVERTLSISFVQSILGDNVDMKLRRPHGKMETVTVKVPAGIMEGKKIRLSGLGNPGRDGGRPGNLFVTIKVEAHPFFTRDEFNLYVRVPVTLKEAVFGAKIEIPTPNGSVNLTVPPGSSSGTKLRIRNQGGPKKGEPGTGDLYVELTVILPKNWNKSDLALLEKLSTEPAQPVRSDLRW